MNSTLISIIIVNWNSCELLKNCLDSIIKTNPNGNFEIILVDNASSDDSVNMVRSEYPNIILIENDENFGFAKACNIGIKASKGDIILFLNSDAELKSPNSFEKVQQFFAIHNEVGILGLQLVFPDGVSQAPGGKFISIGELFKHQILFFDSPIFHKIIHKMKISKNNNFYEIDYVSGACFFIRREVINEVGLFDESFFMYGEDMDYCYRAKQRGWTCVILPSIEVVHLKSQSTKKNLDCILYHSIANNCFLINKIYGKNQALIAHSIYSIGLILRFFFAFIRKKENPVSYLKLFSRNIRLQLKLLTS